MVIYRDLSWSNKCCCAPRLRHTDRWQTDVCCGLQGAADAQWEMFCQDVTGWINGKITWKIYGKPWLLRMFITHVLTMKHDETLGVQETPLKQFWEVTAWKVYWKPLSCIEKTGFVCRCSPQPTRCFQDNQDREPWFGMVRSDKLSKEYKKKTTACLLCIQLWKDWTRSSCSSFGVLTSYIRNRILAWIHLCVYSIQRHAWHILARLCGVRQGRKNVELPAAH